MERVRVGYLDPDVAASVGQFATPTSGRIRVSGREVLASTTQLVGATWGESHRNVLIALTMLYVERGEDGKAGTSLTELSRLIYGGSTGKARSAIVVALRDLYRGELTIDGFDVTTGQHVAGVYSRTRLLIDLVWHKQLERILDGKLRERADIGRQTGGTRGESTIRWRFHPAYAERVDSAEVVSLDWERLRALHGVAQSIWIQLSAPRFEFAPIVERPASERLELLLDDQAYHAFGVRAQQDRDRRRTLNQAGERLIDVDPSYEAFEAHGGKAVPSRLLVVRRTGAGGRKATLSEQLELAA